MKTILSFQLIAACHSFLPISVRLATVSQVQGDQNDVNRIADLLRKGSISIEDYAFTHVVFPNETLVDKNKRKLEQKGSAYKTANSFVLFSDWGNTTETILKNKQIELIKSLLRRVSVEIKLSVDKNISNNYTVFIPLSPNIIQEYGLSFAIVPLQGEPGQPTNEGNWALRIIGYLKQWSPSYITFCVTHVMCARRSS